MIAVLDTHIDKDEIWFKVRLERNTDVLAKVLYTEDELKQIKKQAIKDFLQKLFDMTVHDCS